MDGWMVGWLARQMSCITSLPQLTTKVTNNSYREWGWVTDLWSPFHAKTFISGFPFRLNQCGIDRGWTVVEKNMHEWRRKSKRTRKICHLNRLNMADLWRYVSFSNLMQNSIINTYITSFDQSNNLKQNIVSSLSLAADSSNNSMLLMKQNWCRHTHI